MGCGTSNGNGSAVDNYNRRPKISVRIQAGAKKLDNEPSVVFIFGIILSAIVSYMCISFVIYI